MKENIINIPKLVLGKMLLDASLITTKFHACLNALPNNPNF